MLKRRPSLTWLLGGAMLVLVAGCGHGGAEFDERPAPQDPVTLEVKNLNWQDVTVYVYRAGSEQRLGLVTSMKTRSFVIPRNLYRTSGQLQFMVKPIGSGERQFSEPLNVEPGWIIVWTVEQRLKYSRIMVR